MTATTGVKIETWDMRQNIILVTNQTICLPDNYVKFELPPETPTYVSIGVDIKDIPKVSDKGKPFDLTQPCDCLFRLLRHTERLLHSQVEGQPRHCDWCQEQISVSRSQIDFINTKMRSWRV